MELMKIVIAEDEIAARIMLKSMVEELDKRYRVVAEVDSVQNAISAIQFHQPDLVLLDIELRDGNGFQVLDAFPEARFQVIFVTGYDQHAIRAFRYSALDYLLKPISRTLLVEALEKAVQFQSPDFDRILRTRSQLQEPDKLPRQLAVPDGNGYSFVSLDDILLITATGNTVLIHLAGGRKLIANHSLSYYEEFLPPNQFFRAHKSHIVNLSQVRHYEAARGGNLVLSNGDKVEVAQRRKAILLEYLKGR
jgi:two-component system LytT family response regulator